MEALVWVIMVFLGVCAVLDWRFKEIPSIFLTSALFVVLTLRFDNLYLGLISLVMAWILLESDYFGGLADVKVMGVIGFMLVSTWYFFAFIGLVGGLGILWKGYTLWKHPKEKECAFVPVLFVSYLILLVFGGIA